MELIIQGHLTKQICIILFLRRFRYVCPPRQKFGNRRGSEILAHINSHHQSVGHISVLVYIQPERRSQTSSENGHRRRECTAVILPIVKPHFEIDIIGKPHLVILSSQAE